MKPFILILFTLLSFAGYAQELTTQIQAKRGVFTQRLYLTDRWIDRITPNMYSADSTNDHVLPTAKAVANYIRSQNFPNYADNDLTLSGDRYHHGAGYNIKFDSIRSYEFNVGIDNIVNHMMVDTQLFMALYTPTNSSILNFKRGKIYGAVTDARVREDTFDFTNFLYSPLSAGWSTKRQNGSGLTYQQSGITSVLDSTYSIIEKRDKSNLSLLNRTGFYQTLNGFRFAADAGPNQFKSRSMLNSGDINFSVYDNDSTQATDYSKLSVNRQEITLDNKNSKTQSTIVNNTEEIRLKSSSLVTSRYNEIFVDSLLISLNSPNGNIRIFRPRQNVDTFGYKPLVINPNGYLGQMSAWPRLNQNIDQVLAIGTPLATDRKIKLNKNAFEIGDVTNDDVWLHIDSTYQVIGDLDGLGHGTGMSVIVNQSGRNLQMGSFRLGNSTRINLTDDEEMITLQGSAGYALRAHTGNGDIYLPQYGNGSKTDGFPSTELRVTGEGKLIEAPVEGFFAQTSTVTVSGTTNETSLIGSGTQSLYGLTIFPPAWGPGKSYRITIHGMTASQLSDTADLKLRLKLGSTTIASTENLKFFPGTHQFSATINVTCRTTGASGRLYTFGTLTTNGKVYNVNNNGFDSSIINMTTDQKVDLTVQISDASPLRVIESYIVNLEEINRPPFAY